MEGDLANIVIRIDIANEDEYERVRAIQEAIVVVNAPKGQRDYPVYDPDKAFSPDFVEYINELLPEVPETETALFQRFAAIGVMNDVTLTAAQKAEVQAGIDAAYAEIQQEANNLQVGNGYFGATTVFGTREYLGNNYMGRAAGAHFGLWGNSKEEANYFMTQVEGEGEIVFMKEQLPPLSKVGFWSITAHDEKVLVEANLYDSYVLTMDKAVFEDDGSLVVKFSSQPETGNWLYTPGGKMVILLRVYQPDPDKITAYIPPPFVSR